MTRQKLFLVIGAIIASIAITGLIVFLNPTPQPSDTPVSEPETTTEGETPTNKEVSAEVGEPTEGGTDGHDEEPFSNSDEAAIFLNARQATEAYAQQPREESSVARQNRLAQFFTANSPAKTRKAPVTSESYSTGQVSTLETNWYTVDEPGRIGVIVYLKVGINTGFNAKDEYQTWVVKMKKSGNGWFAYDIEKSDLTYIPEEK